MEHTLSIPIWKILFHIRALLYALAISILLSIPVGAILFTIGSIIAGVFPVTSDPWENYGAGICGLLFIVGIYIYAICLNIDWCLQKKARKDRGKDKAYYFGYFINEELSDYG